MTWPVAMLCLLPILAASGLWTAKMRMWLILMATAFAGMQFSATAIIAFAFIDGIGGYFSLKRPRGEFQWAIGLLFIAAVGLHVGFYIAGRMQPGPHDFMGYALAARAIGWLQFACLASWGVRDAVVRFIDRRGSVRDVVAMQDGF